jgi:hypothetical protein
MADRLFNTSRTESLSASWRHRRSECPIRCGRQKGELLRPEHELAHVLAELKREMGPGGAIIKRKWLTPYDDIRPQPDDRIIMSWDIALSAAETGDYSACVVLLRRKEVFYFSR